ncbi:acetylornithine deacetylase [Pseudooceanicola sp. 216_PA32_1]|uniref:Acetylornithine deacetylase n=1 Tax=Pseudooceanicola pacificus TaxID=2676438 RepID=A0A844W3F8_9RHOB|nr:acetylornithine deacetylase [Pseudooceanicola pacificus]MWB78716.1 acetylornithine deacetylase [Pseudooceanicola pacificus]
MRAAEILERLVGFPTVVGTPNMGLMDYVAHYLAEHGARVTRLMGPEGDRENLFATIGDPSRPGYILSGHVDVVPAQEPEWLGDPFVLRRDGDRLIGRGACDMKGFDAAVLAAVPELAAMPLKAPVHIALSYDEEAGCRGVPHLLARLPELCAAPLGCIVGEPTGLVPVLAHKGKAALRLVASGVSGHSSRPDLGRNAIHALAPALAATVALADALKSGAQDARFAPSWSTVQIGTVAGGQALNIIPDRAEACIEARAIHGVDPRGLLAPLMDLPGVEVEWLSSYPALALGADHPLATLAADISGHGPLQAVSYGTEAGLFQQAGVPAIVCGPGDIARAHKPEEYLTGAELAAATGMVLALGRRLC